MARLALIAVEGLPLIQPGDDLPALVLAALSAQSETLQEDDVIVFAQKIVSKAEDRFIDLTDVTPGAEATRVAQDVAKDPRLVEIILSQSRRVVRARRGVLIVEHELGLVMANAGVDHSNIDGAEDRVLLLPRDPDASAAGLRDAFLQRGHRVGVIINDSFGRAWRQGTVGVAIGVAGLPALLDRRGDADLFGHPLQSTVIGHADELAAAASILMGPAAEARPVVIIRGLPASNAAPGQAADLMRPAAQDLFR
jgi:coenzyme F420-0:L-glutamate ligase/coenzyme F420-1:gamma-L-glutamate ligase